MNATLASAAKSRITSYALRFSGYLPVTLIFTVSWLVYLGLIYFVLGNWKITGDEPHYLLAAHSLAHDGDLDLADNYASRDYAAFYANAYLDPHVAVQPDGTQRLTHDVGLPVLLAPAYALDGRRGVMRFAALLGALLAVQMFLLAWEVSGRRWVGVFGWLAMAFSAPLVLYVFQVYPELAGGLLVIWASRHILGTPAWRAARPAGAPPTRTLLLAPALAALPWLSGRFAPLMLLLVALTVWKCFAQRGQALAVGAAAVASFAAYLAVNIALFGGPTPATAVAGSAVGAGFGNVAAQQVGRGLAGWWFDQHRGLLVYGPILIVAVFGVPHLWRARGLDGLLLLAPITIMWLLAAVWGGFYIAWEISARFLIVGLPLMVAPLAAIFGRIRAGWRGFLFWPLTAGLLTFSTINAAIVFLRPFMALHESPVTVYEKHTHRPIRSYLPAAGTRYLELPPDGMAEWIGLAGQPGYLHQSDPIDNLSIGWYKLYGQAHLTGATDPAAVALTIDIFSSEVGIPLLHADVRPADADPATGFVNLALPFFNPYYDKWNYPFYLDVRTTGTADVRLSRLLFEPDPAESYKRVAAWLSGILLLTILFALPEGLWRRWRDQH